MKKAPPAKADFTDALVALKQGVALVSALSTLSTSDMTVPPAHVEHIKRLLSPQSPRSVHVLIHGPSGAGKTAFARAVVEEIGACAVPIACGRPNDRRDALVSVLTEDLVSDPIFVMDDADALLNLSRDEDDGSGAWPAVLMDVDAPGMRMIWIVRDASRIDASMMRRFSFVVRVGSPDSHDARMAMWRHILGRALAKHTITEDELARLASHSSVSPGIAARAAAAADASAKWKRGELVDAIELSLMSILGVMGQGGSISGDDAVISEGWSDEGICFRGGETTESVIRRFTQLDAAMRAGESVPPCSANTLLFGPPGTGKSALARAVAAKLGRPLVVRKASDLFSRWLGETEKAISRAFADARGGVLLLDEVDSFIYSRRDLSHSWEGVLINQFLTELERSRDFVICTTNMMENLDMAALRRFAVKLELTYCSQREIVALYASHMLPLLGGSPPKMAPETKKRLLSMPMLAPGDFASVSANMKFLGEEVRTHEAIVDALAAEQRMKSRLREMR